MIPADAALLVDGNNLTMRAVKALEASGAHLGDEVNTGPAHLVAKMLGRYVRAVRPATMAVAWDAGHHWRSAISPDYKAHRNHSQPNPAFDPAARPTAFSLVQEFLALSSVCQVFAPGYEADDVIAYYVRRHRPAVILSADKDLLQLVGPEVVQLRPTPNTDIAQQVWDPERVRGAYEGCEPRNLPMLMALAGDSSDGINGVHRVGVKTGARLLSEMGWSFEELPERLSPHADLIERNVALIDLSAPPEPVGLPTLTAFRPTRHGDILWQDLMEWCDLYEFDQLRSSLSSGTYWEEGPT